MRDIWHPERVSAERLEQELNLFALRPSILISMVHVALGRPCEQLFESASGIRCPALFIHGAKDVLVPVACARSIHERIGNGAGDAHFEVLPTAGHMLIQYQASDLAGLILRHIGADERGVAEAERISYLVV